MVKNLLLYGFLACSIASSFLNVAASDEDEGTSVIIVGAGLAGITAAKTLSEAGVTDFVILEATNGVGGRLREDSLGGVRVETGAGWVVGMNETSTNPIWKLVQKYGLNALVSDLDNLTHNIYTKRYCVALMMPLICVLCSGRVKPLTAQPVYQQYQDLDAFVGELGEAKNKEDGADMPVIAAQRIYGKVPTSPVEMVLDYYTYDWEFGEPATVTSLKHCHPNAMYVDFGAHIATVYDQRGMSYIIHKEAEEFLKTNDDRLKLETVVRKIEYSPTGVRVTTEDGKVYKSKYIIVTVSLGVLQSGLIDFVPALPNWKAEALNKFDMALFLKIFVKFPSSFWPHGNGTEYFLYADERRGYYPIWQHLDLELPGEHILIGYATDVEGRRIEQQPLSRTKEEIMDVLRNMFGNDIPEATEILMPKWWSNKYFAGTHTNWPVGVYDYEFKRIQAHIDSVYFAGEHTHPLYKGNCQGAYYTGMDAAKEVLECLAGSNCETVIPQPEAVFGSELRRSMMTGSRRTVSPSEKLVEKWTSPRLH